MYLVSYKIFKKLKITRVTGEIILNYKLLDELHTAVYHNHAGNVL